MNGFCLPSPLSAGGPVRLLARLERLSEICSDAGMTLFVVMAFLTAADAYLRYLFSAPLSGTVELCELMMAIVVFSSLAYAQWRKSHIIMDIVIARLNPNRRCILQCATTIWSLAVLAAVVRAMASYGWHTTKTSSILGIPYAPFILTAASGVGLLWLSLLHDALKLFAEIQRPWRVMVLPTAVLPLVGACLLAGHTAELPPAVVGGVGLLTLFALFFLGMPVPFAMMGVGFVFTAHLKGLFAASALLGGVWYDSVASYAWAPLLFFIFMGYVCFYSRFGEDMYAVARACVGNVRGGLAMATVLACTLFGAVVGDVITASAAMSAIALPEMRKAGYQDSLSVGVLACSGTIGCLIPPSTVFILYGMLSGQSVPRLFMAGILPGLLCAGCFILAVWLMVRIRPELAPPLPRNDRTAGARPPFEIAVPILGLFTAVVGGMYAGIFTPTEGGGIGAVITLIFALATKRMRLAELKAALRDSANFAAMTFTVIGGSMLVAYLLTLSRIPFFLADTITALNAPPLLILALIILSLCFLGAFFPNIPLLLICVPIFLPVAKMYQWDLIWFGVLMVLVFNMAAITPPFGISLFVMKGLADIPLSVMYCAALPFVGALFLCIVLCVLFPELSTFLAS